MAFQSDEERRVVIAALKAFRNRLGMALRVNARRGWKPAAGHIDSNLARLTTVNALIVRWHKDETP